MRFVEIPNLMSQLRTTVRAGLVAVCLTWIFWQPLWYGGGFVGGDIYSYYFPQKTLYAETLHAGEVPFWNWRTGFGYPLVAESQTGVFYPFHLIAYAVADVNTAYSAIQLLHYILAFVFTALFARCFNLSWWSSLLAALVYAFAWFPARSCVEWAVICGAWLPAALFCAERFLQTRRWGFAIGLSAVLGVQMLAGHFEIAFITQLTLVAYIPLRLWWARDELLQLEGSKRRSACLLLAGAFVLGFALAATQLLPTVELKRISQRASADQHEIEFGSIPLWYLSQTALPWKWYSPLTDRDSQLQRDPPVLGGRTNQVEAHLYFGLLPLALALWGIAIAVRQRNRTMLLWAGLGLASLIYTTGILLPVTRHLPGFSFFQGPGRYGVLSTLAVAMLAAFAFDQMLARLTLAKRDASFLFVSLIAAIASCWLLTSDSDSVAEQLHIRTLLSMGRLSLNENLLTIGGTIALVLSALALAIWTGLIGRDGRWRNAAKSTLAAAILMVTVCDLWIVSRLVTYTTVVDDPPIRHLDDSPIRQALSRQRTDPVRLFAPGANLPNVFGVSSVPVYFTFAPKAYSTPRAEMPQVANSADVRRLKTSREQLDWLRWAGVTHVLSEKPLDDTWPTKLIWHGIDPVLNGAWHRSEELWLYRIDFAGSNDSGRARFVDQTSEQHVNITEYSPHQIMIETTSRTPGRLVLAELMYPGWVVSVDDEESTPMTSEKIFRGVDLPQGSHTIVWNFRPRSLYYGAGISIAALLVLATVAHFRFWHGDRLEPRDEQVG